MTATPEAPTVSVGDYVYQLSALVEAFNAELALLKQANQGGTEAAPFNERVTTAMERALRCNDGIRAAVPLALLGGIDGERSCQLLSVLAYRSEAANAEFPLGSAGSFAHNVGVLQRWVVTQLAHAMAPNSRCVISSTLSSQLLGAYAPPDAEALRASTDRLNGRQVLKILLRPIIQELIVEIAEAPSEGAEANVTAEEGRPDPGQSDRLWDF